MSTDRPALRRCVAGSTDAFARDTWARRPLLSPYDALGAPDAAFGDLFSLAAVDELLSRRGLRTPFIRIARNGEVVGEKRYTRSGGAGALIADQVADDRVLSLFDDGHTVVLQGLHRLWPPLIAFAGALTEDLGHPVQINAYITPPSSQGFAAHYDVHDVFVLQVAGEKRWRIHEPVHPEPLRSEPWTEHRAAVEARAEQAPVLDAVLRPGDALYLPRGFLHAAQALGGVSCHLTVGVQPLTRQAVLDAIVALVRDDPALRSSLPLGVDLEQPGALDADLRAVTAALLERLQAVTPVDVARLVAERAVPSTRPAPVPPLAQAAALAALDGDSLLVGRAHLRHAVHETADEVIVTLPDRTLRLPASTGKAVRAVLDGTRLPVHELPDLGPEDAVALARRLVREGVALLEVDPGDAQ
ncbi:MAG: cupin domain-containing protein [Actinomycetes bacterium]